MVPKVLDPRSLFGVTCVRCGNDLIAPEKSEHLDDRRIRHLWHCPKCRVRFEAFLRFPAEAKSITISRLKWKFPNLCGKCRA